MMMRTRDYFCVASRVELLQLALFSLSLDVTAYTSVLLWLSVSDPECWQRGKIDCGNLHWDPAWKISSLWIWLRCSHHHL